MHASSKALLTLVFLAALGVAAKAAEPAVSGPNGKISVEGGTFDDEEAGLALGSVAIPLGHSFGAQADGALGAIDGDTLGGGGLHLFTRDPASYLLGVYGGYHTWDGIDIWRLAGEAELYLGRFTLDGLAGFESIDGPTNFANPTLTIDDDHFFAQTDLAYYITDDFKVYGGYRYLNETSFGAAGTEYLIRGYEVPVSLFARGDFGVDEYTSITGGLKVYLSGDPQKSLIDRHRRDDPDIYVPVFPKRAVGATQCTAGPGPQYKVTSDTSCTCPSGTPRAGSAPKFISALGGFYTCGNPS
jgi:hypothetical protein